MGLVSVEAATTCTGEVTVALLTGVVTQTEPALVVPGVGGGSGAGSGNGAIPVVGPWLSARTTVGHELLCCADPPEEDVEVVELPLPHPAETMVKAAAIHNNKNIHSSTRV